MLTDLNANHLGQYQQILTNVIEWKMMLTILTNISILPNTRKSKLILTNLNPCYQTLQNLTNVNKKWRKATHTAAECGTAQLS